MKKVLTNFNRLPAILTVEQCSVLFHIEPRTIRRYCAQGTIPAFKVGKLWRIDKEELKAFMEGAR